MKLKIASEISTRKTPVNLERGDYPLFSKEFLKEIPAVRTKTIQNAIVLPTGKLFNGLSIATYQFSIPIDLKGLLKTYLLSLASFFRIRRVKIIHTAIFFTSNTTTNFFHWFLDSLQKLEYISINSSDKDNISLIVPANHDKEFILKSINNYNYKSIIQSNSELLFIRNLTFIPDIAPTGNYRKDVILSLRQRFKNNLNRDKKLRCENPKKIYITRKNAKKRKILNEDDLMPILNQHDIDVIDMDILPYEEQLKAVYEADVLVSLHGAGLTHMMWMKNNGKVLEIRARNDDSNNCYFTLASDLELQYYYAIADKNNSKLTTQQADYTIDPKHFEYVLGVMLTE